MNIQDTTVL